MWPWLTPGAHLQALGAWLSSHLQLCPLPTPLVTLGALDSCLTHQAGRSSSCPHWTLGSYPLDDYFDMSYSPIPSALLTLVAMRPLA